MWKEQIGEGNEQVSQLKQSFVTMTENLLTARSPQAWDKVTENRDQKYCPENNYFEFVPGTAASVTPNSPQTWTGSCFGHMQAKLTSKGGGNYSLTMGGSNANSSGCSDTYLLTTSYTILGVLDISALDSSQTLPFSVEGSLKELDIERHGVHIMVSNLQHCHRWKEDEVSIRADFDHSLLLVGFWAPSRALLRQSACSWERESRYLNVMPSFSSTKE